MGSGVREGKGRQKKEDENNTTKREKGGHETIGQNAKG